jgi:hypothetical protein
MHKNIYIIIISYLFIPKLLVYNLRNKTFTPLIKNEYTASSSDINK